jgi:hypothetical protein
MKAIPFLILIVPVLTLAVAGCERDDLTNSRKEILISKSWKISSYKINDEEIALMDCQKDNYLTFDKNGTYTDFAGTEKCEVSEINITGTWTLSDDGKILTLKSFQGVQTAALEITESKLVLTITDDTDIIVMICVPYQ